MSSSGEDVYATLLLNDIYLPGALVLAHSLRDAGTTKKLAVLVTTESVSIDGMLELRKLFDYVIPVERITNESPEKLHLMNRPDLHSTFTKILLWKQLQFRKIVYVDSDMIALRAPDELFDLPHTFSAAPDIGWPDIFNSGLMVLSPNIDEYYALLEMAQNGISFDGADQGLLNMHFSNSYNRLSFTYNVTPSAHYQYVPAYRHFKPMISMAHFIGQHKPWFRRRQPGDDPSPHDEMVEKWWEVHDRHFEAPANKVETHHDEKDMMNIQEKTIYAPDRSTESETIICESHRYDVDIETLNNDDTCETGFHVPQGQTTEKLSEEGFEKKFSDKLEQKIEDTCDAATGERTDEECSLRIQIPNPPSLNWEDHHVSAWDASKEPPPILSKPEASNFPVVQYTMSSDPTPYKAPDRYPDPPRDMWYEVPKTPTNQKLSPIFPWEYDSQQPSRVFPEDYEDNFTLPLIQNTYPELTERPQDVEDSVLSSPQKPIFSNPWQSFTLTNAWDDVPEIEQYVGKITERRKEKSNGSLENVKALAFTPDRSTADQNSKLINFTHQATRSSLPVSSAPNRRPEFWVGECFENQLPSAEGVPSQEEWDPITQLDQLTHQQSRSLALKLKEETVSENRIPSREFPLGSESIRSNMV
ncbi:hypothetical protein K3495_g3908 [Podosphaera aphanis]|nr:hypothetical protein K3495_g3908 [Podosphaera aphanis]